MPSPKLLLLALALSTPLHAQDIKIVGTLEQSFKMPYKHLATSPHSIKLLKVELSKPAERALTKRTAQASSPKAPLSTSKNTPRKINLGMNDVPVLDQGSFGTCVTFATTSAINAALNKGDYISQLCQLQLGNYLQTNGYTSSGWDGSLGRFVLSQIETYGIVTKEQQETVGCGGLTHYPAYGQAAPTSSINPETFHQISQSVNDRISWSPILDVLTSMDKIDTNKTVDEIKKALIEKDRVTFGVLLLDFDLGLMGAVGSHSSGFDSWVLTPEIARDIYLRPMFGGHEMIITGYDDDAIATDDQGRQHKGLFTLRNSWGDQIGDKGNFYMSYDYFKVLVIEAQRIRTMPADGGVDSVTA
jgi:hypothetical protein